MATQHELKVAERDNTLTGRKLRQAGYIPVTLYGNDIQPVHIQAKAHEFTQLAAHGVKTFKLSGFVNVTAKLQQLQMDSLSQHPISVALLLVDGTVEHGKKTDKTSQPASKKKTTKKEPVLAS